MADELCVHQRERDRSWLRLRLFFRPGYPCPECEREQYAAWLESVRERLDAGLKAAGAGEPFDWNEPEPDETRYAILRFNDLLDVALAPGADGRVTAPVAGRYTFGDLTALQAAARDESVLTYLRHGVMTLAEAREIYGGDLDAAPLFPDGAGGMLHALLNPEPGGGPPWTHTIRPPQPECDEDGEPYWPQPITHTIEFVTTPADGSLHDPGAGGHQVEKERGDG